MNRDDAVNSIFPERPLKSHENLLNCGKYLNLEQHVLLRFALVLTLGCAICGTIAHINTSAAISSSVNEMAIIMVNSEKISMKDRLRVLSKSAESLFKQAVDDIILLADTAEVSLNNSDSNPNQAYSNYRYLDKDLLTEFDVTESDYVPGNYSRFRVTSWYNGTSTFDEKFKDINETSLLGNYLIPVATANRVLYDGQSPTYIGTESGIFRKNGWGSFDANKRFTYMDYYCKDSFNDPASDAYITSENPEGYPRRIGYDPRCRGWYDGAKRAYFSTPENYTFFSPPYLDAGTGIPMITVARAVVTNYSFFGAVGIDFLLTALSNSVLSATIMNNGYTYLATKSLDIIMHPAVDNNAGVQTVKEVEFKGASSSEADTFCNLLATSFEDDTIQTTAFTKGGQRWYSAFQSVAGTDYVMVMVVPYSDLENDSDDLEANGEQNVNTVLICTIVITIAVAFISFFLAHKLIRQISGPVSEMNNVLAKINASEMEASGVAMTSSDFVQVNRLQSRILSLYLAIRFSTNAYYDGDHRSALMYLDQVEQMFKGIRQNHALGVVFNNKGSILKASNRLDDSVWAYGKAIEIARVLLTKSQTKAEQARRNSAIHPDSAKIQDDLRKWNTRLERYSVTLANRLSNVSVTHKEKREFESSLEVLGEAEALVMEHDNFMTMLRVFGNKGLTLLEMGRVHDAEELFDQSYGLAEAAFKNDRQVSTLHSFQFAAMNKANFLTVLALKGERSDKERREKLNEALNMYYMALTVSNKMRKDMLSRCIPAIQSIYKYYEGGEVAAAALSRIFGGSYGTTGHSLAPGNMGNMSNAKISFLVDVSPSMNANNRIGQATDTLLHIFDEKMKHGDFIYIAAFSNKFYTIVEPTSINIEDESHAIMRDAIEKLRYKATSGTTHFYLSLILLANNIPQNSANEENWVIALTDGCDNGRVDMKEPIELYKRRGIKLIIIAIDMDKEPEAMRSMRRLVTNDNHLLSTTDGSIEKALSRSYAIAHGDIVMESL